MRAPTCRILFIIALVGGIFLVPHSVRAAPSAADIKRAAEAFDRGREDFRAESYVEAAEHFEAADDSAPSAAALRLAIAARKAAGQMQRALTLAALALATYPDDEDVREEAQAVIDEYGADYGKVIVHCDEPCQLSMDAKLVHGPKANEHTVYLEPGSHQIQASWTEDRSGGKQVTVVAGETREIDLFAPAPESPSSEFEASEKTDTSWYEDEPTEADDIAQDDASKGWSPAVFWTGAGLTAVGLGVTTYLGVKTINEPGQEAVRANCPTIDCDLYRQGVANQTAANVAAGMTATVGVFTLVTAVWLTDWSGKKKQKETTGSEEVWSFRTGPFTVRPEVSVNEGATLGASGTF